MNQLSMTSPLEVAEPDIDISVEVTPDMPWVVLVWNDPINLMSYVTFVLRKLFGYSEEKATELMLDVHHKGRAVVSSCLLYTSPSPRDKRQSRMPSSA